MKRTRLLICSIVLLAAGMTAQFTVDTRLVQVYATVFDKKGNFIDGIGKDQFVILDDGVAQPVHSFEAESAGLSCAILLDTTGSMQGTLGSVRNSVSSFLGQMRDDDSVAIFGFSSSLYVLQDFTLDKSAAKRAVLRTRAEGGTALFDAVAQLTHVVAARSGKKVIVLFTDGDDNLSSLRQDAAVRSSLKTGVPIYTIAEGDATRNKNLLRVLETISKKTGGICYQAKSPKDVAMVFQDIQADMKHVYLISYKAPQAPQVKWHDIRVQVAGSREFNVRAKQGYFPE